MLKTRNPDVTEARASRFVGGKYRIEYVEGRYSEEYGTWFEHRDFTVYYYPKGSGGYGNINTHTSTRTQFAPSPTPRRSPNSTMRNAPRYTQP